MTQFIKRKAKAIIKFKIDDLDEKDTTIKLNSINPAQLDKKYIKFPLNNLHLLTFIDKLIKNILLKNKEKIIIY